MNPTAACLAATIRLGGTSVFSIERDVSRERTTVARSRGTLRAAFGPAIASPSKAIPVNNNPAGKCRLQPGESGVTFGLIAGAVKARAERPRSR
jgi:hypothetical protein